MGGASDTDESLPALVASSSDEADSDEEASSTRAPRRGAGGGDGAGEDESGYGIGQSALVGSSPPLYVQAPQQQLQQQQMQMLPETFPVPAECFRVLASDSVCILTKCSL